MSYLYNINSKETICLLRTAGRVRGLAGCGFLYGRNRINKSSIGRGGGGSSWGESYRSEASPDRDRNSVSSFRGESSTGFSARG